MRTLQSEGTVITPDNDIQDACKLAVLGMLKLSHSVLKLVIGIGEGFANSSCVARAAGDIVVLPIWIEDRELRLLALVGRAMAHCSLGSCQSMNLEDLGATYL